MPEFQVALVVTLPSETYEDALREAELLAEGIGMDGENVYAVTDYEEDHDGQRVLYLPRPTYGDLIVLVDWDATDEEASEAEQLEALKSLPDQVVIPAVTIDEWIEDAYIYERRDFGEDHTPNIESAIDENVADYLSDEYGYCVNGWARVE